METDIGNPIEYSPNLDPLIQEKNEDNNKDEMIQDQPYYFHPSEMNYPQSPPQSGKFDPFTDIDKQVLLEVYNMTKRYRNEK